MNIHEFPGHTTASNLINTVLGSRETTVPAFRDLVREHRGVNPTNTVPCDQCSEGGKNGSVRPIREGFLEEVEM